MYPPTNASLGMNGRQVLFCNINLLHMVFLLGMIFGLKLEDQPASGYYLIAFMLYRAAVILFERDVLMMHLRHIAGIFIFLFISYDYYHWRMFNAVYQYLF